MADAINNERHREILVKLTDDAPLVDKFLAGDETVKLEDLMDKASAKLWNIHKTQTDKVGGMLQNTRIEEYKKHIKIFAKELNIPDADLETLTDFKSAVVLGKQKYEAELRKNLDIQGDAELKARLNTLSDENNRLKQDLKYQIETHVPALEKRFLEYKEEVKREMWFLDYTKKFELTIPEKAAQKTIEAISKEIFDEFGIKKDPDGKIFLTDKKTGEKIPKNNYDHLTLDEVIVSHLRNYEIFKESNAKDKQNTPTGGNGNPPNGKPPISDAQAERMRKAQENLERMNAQRGK